MENFIYYNKTKIIFGKDVEEGCGEECRKYGKKVLVHYGGGSVVKSGLLDRVIKSLQDSGMEVFTLGGVVPNPRLSLVYQGIELVKKEKIDIVLAVGGGSVIDSSKAIALGARYNGDVWDFYIGKAVPTDIMPIGTILTIPAAGSESSFSTVITNDMTGVKRSFRNDINRPFFSFLDPKLIVTVPLKHQIAGIIDMYSHVVERYFTNSEHVELTSQLCEATMRSIIIAGPKFIQDPTNYDNAAEIMWTASFAHNSMIEVGRITDWGTHAIEHEISAEYDLTHGLGIAIILPAQMKYVYKHNIKLFARYARNVYSIEESDDEKAALKGIEATQKFFESLGAKTTLTSAGIPTDQFEKMAKRAVLLGPVGHFVSLDVPEIIDIYNLAK